MTTKAITEANRRAWNAVAPIHRKATVDALRARFAVPGASSLDDVATERLLRLGVRGKRVAHLCCNNGQELLSLMNLGAASGVGFDISEVVIEEARELAATSSIDCAFVAGDVYEIPEGHTGAFDLVFISVGALGWMPDLAGFFAVAGRLLGSGGALFVYEMHPILDMYDPQAEPPLVPRDSYFRQDPFVETVGLDYVSKTQFDGPPQYWFHHTMASILSSVLAAGVDITSFDEFPHDVSDLYAALANASSQLPMSYILTGRKR